MTDDKVLSLEDARAAIEAERQQRAQECSREIAEVLAKHRCDLDVSLVLRAGQVIPQVQVVAK